MTPTRNIPLLVLSLAVGTLAGRALAQPAGNDPAVPWQVRPPLELQVQEDTDGLFFKAHVVGEASTAGSWYTVLGRVYCQDPEYFAQYGQGGSRAFLEQPAEVTATELGLNGDYSGHPPIRVGSGTLLNFLVHATLPSSGTPSVYQVAMPLLNPPDSTGHVSSTLAVDYPRWNTLTADFWHAATADASVDAELLSWDTLLAHLVLAQGAGSGITAAFLDSQEYSELTVDYGVVIELQPFALQGAALIPDLYPIIDDPSDPAGPGGLGLPEVPILNIGNSFIKPIGGRVVIVSLTARHRRPSSWGPLGPVSPLPAQAGQRVSVQMIGHRAGTVANLLLADGTRPWVLLTATAPGVAEFSVPAAAPAGPMEILAYSGVLGTTNFAPDNRLCYTVQP